MSQLPDDVDAELIPLLNLINSHHAFQSTCSCAGHYRWCRCYLLHESLDDRNMELVEAVNFEERFCRGSHAPFLQLLIEEPYRSTFVSELHMQKPSRLQSECWVSPRGEVCLSYNAVSDEGFRTDWRDNVIGPAFDLFWQHTFRAFAATVKESPTVPLPTKFAMERKWRATTSCCHCAENVWIQESEPPPLVKSWEDVELFYQDHMERSCDSHMLTMGPYPDE